MYEFADTQFFTDDKTYLTKQRKQMTDTYGYTENEYLDMLEDYESNLYVNYESAIHHYY